MAALMLACVELSACRLDAGRSADPNEPIAGSCVGAMTAGIEGLAWNGRILTQVRYTGVSLSVTGIDAQQRLVSLAVPSVTSSGGTFTIGTSSGAIPAIAAFAVGGNARWTAGTVAGTSGSITVQAVSQTRAAGTFSFTAIPDPVLTGNQATGTLHVTTGVFDLSC